LFLLKHGVLHSAPLQVKHVTLVSFLHLFGGQTTFSDDHTFNFLIWYNMNHFMNFESPCKWSTGSIIALIRIVVVLVLTLLSLVIYHPRYHSRLISMLELSFSEYCQV
jgi:hypothetical protein